jgi:hypothetical protein
MKRRTFLQAIAALFGVAVVPSIPTALPRPPAYLTDPDDWYIVTDKGDVPFAMRGIFYPEYIDLSVAENRRSLMRRLA